VWELVSEPPLIKVCSFAGKNTHYLLDQKYQEEELIYHINLKKGAKEYIHIRYQPQFKAFL
jgi:hypothetical protein